MEVSHTLNLTNTIFRTSHDHFLNVTIENLTKIGNEVIEISHFIELNMTAVRKILKKYDKQL